MDRDLRLRHRRTGAQALRARREAMLWGDPAVSAPCDGSAPAVAMAGSCGFAPFPERLCWLRSWQPGGRWPRRNPRFPERPRQQRRWRCGSSFRPAESRIGGRRGATGGSAVSQSYAYPADGSVIVTGDTRLRARRPATGRTATASLDELGVEHLALRRRDHGELGGGSRLGAQRQEHGRRRIRRHRRLEPQALGRPRFRARRARRLGATS